MCNLATFASDLCLNEIENEGFAILIDILIFIYTFGCLAIAAEQLCKNLEILCSKWRLPEDIAGATFMAVGSAMPEICVNAISTMKEETGPYSTRRFLALRAWQSIHGATHTNSDATTVENNGEQRNGEILGIGAILGSGFIALVVIPSLCSLWSPKRALVLARRPLIRDLITYIVGITLLMHSIITERATIWHSLFLLLVYASYITFMICRQYVWPPQRTNGETMEIMQPVPLEDVTLLGNRRNSQGTSQTLESILLSSVEAGSPRNLGDASPRNVGEATKDKAHCSQENEENNNCEERENGSGALSTGEDPTMLGSRGREVRLSADVEQSDQISVATVNSDSYLSVSSSLASRRQMVVKKLCKIWTPVEWIVGKTIPENEKWYMFAVFMSFIYIGIFSLLITDSANFIVSKIADSIADSTEANKSTGNAILALCGLLFVSLGAEVPDAIQAVTAAKRGHGSMAASSCLGSQVCNICVGCGLPWLIANMVGSNITFEETEFLFIISSILIGVAFFVFASVVIMSRCGSLTEVTICSRMAKSMLFSYGFYVISLGTVCIVLSLPPSPDSKISPESQIA